jgi:hypothetical protein
LGLQPTRRQRRRHRFIVAPYSRPRGAGDGERRLEEVIDSSFDAPGGREGILGGPCPDSEGRRPGKLVSHGMLQNLSDGPLTVPL